MSFLNTLNPIARLVWVTVVASVSFAQAGHSAARLWVTSQPLTTNLAFVRTDYPTADFPYSIASADFNRDGQGDLITPNYFANSISIYLQNLDGNFIRTDYPWPTSGTSVLTGDFNGDGNPDYAAGNGLNVSIVLGNGNGTFQPRTDYYVGGGFLNPVNGDFNNDGNVDLVALGLVLLGNGDGTFGAPLLFDDYVGGSLGVGDLNRDGKLDLVIPHYGYLVPSTVNVLPGNGDGTFGPALQFKIPRHGGGAFVGDFNNDGNLDVVVAHGGLDFWGISVLLGNGDGTLGAATFFSFAPGQSVLAASDINQDGKLDLVLADPSAALGIMLGNGDGTFQSSVDFAASHDIAELVVADLNNDNAPDIATSAGSLNVLSVFLNQAGTLVRANSRPNPSNVGQAILFQVKVFPTFTGLPTPTGTITLKDGAQSLVTLKLHLGRARWKTASLSSGTHVITAHYSGDVNYNPNAAAPITQVVNP